MNATADILDLWQIWHAEKAAILAVMNDSTLSGDEYLAAMAKHEAAWKAVDLAIQAIHPMRAV